ncbi:MULTISPECIES: putative leader peptide [unclassified Streptomyces]|nr:putative leader peptide [Streptomyces sp. NRRL S-31]
MTRLETEPGRTDRTPPRAPLLTSRRHIDLQRVCSAIGGHR